MTHPTIEYLFVPDQDLRRFGNRIAINHYGMRSEAFSSAPEPKEIRLLFFGDSVINGGALTDQKDLATEIVKRKLALHLNQSVAIGNVSAGSWGPGNWLAYAKEYGFFGAAYIVLVLSGHDATDNPTFELLNPLTHPTKKPYSAISEALSRYVAPKVLERSLKKTPAAHNPVVNEPAALQKKELRKAQGIADLHQFLMLASENGRPVIVFYHPELVELKACKPHPHKADITALLKELKTPYFDLSEAYQSSPLAVEAVYRDNIHPASSGQEAMGNFVLGHLVDLYF